MTQLRVRFAPSPTGMMHLGNVRTAVINFLFAQQKNGTFIIRIEDTDNQRMLDPNAKKILEDLAWLGITYNEGPIIEGPYKPYFQSQRMNIYEEKRALLENKNLIYQCFCTEEELEKKRDRQIALKLPPRYDRTCLTLSTQEKEHNITNKIPFIWRFKLDHEKSITITDLAHGKINFSLNNFSDFAITRQDGSFTFMFANFVDDWTMNISHVFRGEDHLSNTANQAALFDALNITLPTYWHMPILCNTEGKKLSKRDFGFSLRDLKDAGFTAEAIDNYVSIIGASFKEEIMSINELAQAYNFKAISSSGRITYDIEKLQWVNKQWLQKYDAQKLRMLCLPFLEQVYPSAATMCSETLALLLQTIKAELTTLKDAATALAFYFTEITLTKINIEACITPAWYKSINKIIQSNLAIIDNPAQFVSEIKKQSKSNNVPLKELFWFLRLALTGKANGPAIHELLEMLPKEKVIKRIEKALNMLS